MSEYNYPQAFGKLRQLVAGIHPLPDDAWQALAAGWQPFSCGRKMCLTRPGEPERFLYFVCEGIQRVFHIDEHLREATLVFMYPPSFGGVLDSILLQSPATYYYETLTPSAFLRLPVPLLHALMEQHPHISTLVRKGLAHTFSGVLHRLAELQTCSAEERLRALLQRSPHILQLVPHKYLANYLGMDATNFSKLLNQVRF